MPIIQLKQSCQTILSHVADLVTQMHEDDYAKNLDLLSGNTVAKHVRHVLELYVQLLSGIAQHEINYDKRERNLLLEHNKTYTLGFINDLQAQIENLSNTDNLLYLNSLVNNEEVLVKSSLARELVYNIEHAIHHMAIINIACKHYFNYIQLDKNFGVAYATLQFQQTCVQ
ncbi:MAG: DinB family protein [Bacteroidota bacterium]